MGAIADVLHRMGHTVTGSDLKDGPVVERLRVAGMEIHVGHDAANVGAADLVAISTAIPEHNPEVRSANERQIPLLRRSDILPAISAERRSIVVAGTHGKTTTSSMLAMAMVEADLDPSFIIGGDVNEIGSGAVWADGEWFIIEGDESDRTFLSLGAEIAIVTNVEPDHLETYDNDPEQLLAAFVQFADAATTPIYCADDAGAMQVASAVPGITYGTAEHADYRMVDIETGRASVTFTIRHDGAEVARVELPTPGMHNARNAAAAFVATIAAGGSAAAAAAALARFGCSDAAGRRTRCVPIRRRRRSGRTSLTGLSVLTFSWSPTSMPQGKPRALASPASSSSMPCSTHIHGPPWPGCRVSMTRPDGWLTDCALVISV